MSDPKTTPLPPPTPSEGSKLSPDAPTRTKSSRLSFAGLKRSASKAIETPQAQSGKKALAAAGKTIIGAHPVWLMGELITGRKVGTQFKKGTTEIAVAADELREILTDSTKDVLVVVDQKLRTGKEETTKTADVLRSAGTDALVVVTSSILASRQQFENNAPGLKHTCLKHSKDVVVILDKAIKHPIVITGVTKFAKSKGIPRSEAILTLAAMGVTKLVKILDEAEKDAKVELDAFEAEMRAKATQATGEEGNVVVVDAGAFDGTVHGNDRKFAEEIGHCASPTAMTSQEATASTSKSAGEPTIPGALPESQKKKDKEDKGCIIV